MDITELRELARQAVSTGDVNSLRSTVEQLEALVSPSDEPNVRADVYRFRGTLSSLQADHENALEAFKKALEILEPLNDPKQIARITNNIGVVYHTKADYPNALSWYQKSLDAREEDGDMMGVSRVSGNIGIVYSSLDDIDRARTYYERSLGISKALNDADGVARSTVAIGNMYVRLGELDKARLHLTDAMIHCKELGLEREWLVAASSLAAILHQRGEYQAAIDLVASAEPVAQRVGLRREQLLLAMARSQSAYKLYGNESDLDALASLVTESQALALASEEKDIHKVLYEYYKQRDDLRRALEHHEYWVELQKRISGEERQRQLILLESEHQLREDRLRMEEHQKLLYNMVPIPIAKRLLRGERKIADSFDSLSVIFTDIVGFTQQSSHMPVEELIAMLNGLFSRYDDVTRKYGITKIKTIGDAYMAVAGAPDALEPHDAAARAANVALEFIQEAQELNIRVGLHAGPAVAGVIGTERMVWDIWGDAVNVAARMEQTASAGRVQVSEEFVRILARGASPMLEGTDIVVHADPFLMRMRGTIDVKGKGEMKTFWLEYLR